MAKEASEPGAINGITADENLLRYGSLRMPPPTEQGRGKLTPVPRERVYLELLTEQRIEVSFSVVQVIRAAFVRAESVATLSLPPRHMAPVPSQFDYAYVADHRADIPSDDAFHSICLTQRTAQASPSFICVPRETQDVFRQVEIENPHRDPGRAHRHGRRAHH